MAIYVDPIFSAPGPRGMNRWSHMGTDDHSHEGIEALHAFAARLGMKLAWYQDSTDHKHYDLVPSKRALAVKLGAIECPSTLAYGRICGRKARLRKLAAAGGVAAAFNDLAGRAEVFRQCPERVTLFEAWLQEDDD